jgi:hypothetical protein
MQPLVNYDMYQTAKSAEIFDEDAPENLCRIRRNTMVYTITRINTITGINTIIGINAIIGTPALE